MTFGFSSSEEARRLEALRRYDLLDTPPEQALDDLTSLAAHICEAPISLITLIDEHRQWFKSKVGITAEETPLDVSVCAHAIRQSDLFVVEDVWADERFAHHPLTVGPSPVRFYAGAPLITPEGEALGTLCVIDYHARQLNDAQRRALQALSRQVMSQLELRRQALALGQREQLLDGQRKVLELMAGGIPFTAGLVALAQFVEKQLEGAQCSVLLLDADGRRLRHAAAPTLPAAFSEAIDGVVIGATVGSCGTAAFLRQEVFVADIATDPLWKDYRELALEHGLASCWSTPIFDEQRRVLGTFAIYNHRLGAPTEGHIRLIEVATHIAAITISRHQSEEASRGNHALLQAIMEGTTDAIFVKDREGRYQVINEAGARLIGHTPAEMLGRKDTDLVSAESARHFRELDDAVIESGEVRVGEETVTFDGDSRVVLTSKAPWRGPDGRILGVIGVSRDITARKAAEVSLRESEHKLRNVMDGFGPHNFVGLLTVDGLLLEANQPALAVAGLTLDDVRGKPVDETYWFSYSPTVQQELRAVIQRAAQGQSSRYDVQIQAADGSLIWIDLSMNPVFGDAGEVLYLVPSSNVIDERKRAEESVQHLNRVYAVLSGINQAIVHERDSLRMLKRACRIAVEKGRFRLAWIGLVDPVSGQFTITAHAGASDETVAILRDLVGGDRPDCDFTYAALQTGEHGVCNDIATDPKSLSWREAALERDYHAMASLPLKQAGQVIGTFNLYAAEKDFFDAAELRLLDELASDISFALEVGRQARERQAAVEELRWKTAFFEAQVESSMDAILVVDNQDKRILQNGRMNEVWSIPPEIAESEDSAVRIAFITRQTTEPERYTEKVAYLRANPDRVSRDEIELVNGTILERFSSPVRDKAGRNYGRIWTFRDITEQRQLEEQFRQSQKMEAIGQLAGGVAHDFNNILAAIMMQADLGSLAPHLPKLARDMFKDIKGATERAANLTRQLLAFSNRQVIQTRQLDLNEIVSSLTKMLQRILGEDVRLELKLHPQPLLTRADAGMLDQVLLNLVVNARDAMPGGGSLCIETGETTFNEKEAAAISSNMQPGRHVSLTVSDSGSGISAENRTRIFEPFFTTKAPGKGTGLGLATVFGIVKQHAGAITLESEEGQGATFRIFLRADDEAPTSPAAKKVETQLSGGAETILLVEDESNVRMLTRIILERVGYTVLEAENGPAALEMWEQSGAGVHLLLTDIVMPGNLSGRELAAQLQALRPALKVIFTSGYSAEIAGRELELLDGQNFIQKPCAPGPLLAAIRRCLDS